MENEKMLSVFELPEPTEIFSIGDGEIGIIFQPSTIYKFLSRLNFYFNDMIKPPLIMYHKNNYCVSYMGSNALFEGVVHIFVIVSTVGILDEYGAGISMRDFEVILDSVGQANN